MAEIEIWRQIPSFPHYEASSEGRIRRTSNGRIKKDRRHPIGYRMVTLYHRTSTLVHAAVCEAFYGLRPSSAHQVAHLDGCRTNNKASNLAWKTPTENHADKILHGTHRHADSHQNAKLTASDVVAIRQALAQGVTGRELGRRYGVHEGTISDIKRGVRWKRFIEETGA